jgi:CDP-diacylglycerol--serine O-phosphatidyltransferase
MNMKSSSDTAIWKATTMVPSLFTVANMFLGFFAIAKAIEGKWIAAPTAVFIAHIMDILDGRVARYMKMTSRFGGEFDSFADWISFGIAPATMVYLLALKDFGKLGFLLAFFFVLCGALRLTRFNLKAMEGEAAPSLNFTGLPIPGAGGMLAVLVLLFGLSESGKRGRTLSLLYYQVPHLREFIPIIMFALALLMISRVQYATFKRTHFFRPQSMVTFLITLFIIFMIYVYPQNTIFLIYFGYIVWGLVQTGWRAYRLRRHAVPTEAT